MKQHETTFKYCYNVVFLFHYFLVITVAKKEKTYLLFSISYWLDYSNMIPTIIILRFALNQLVHFRSSIKSLIIYGSKQRSTIVEFKVLWILGSSIWSPFFADWRIYLIPLRYPARTTKMQGSGIDPQIQKCPHWISRSSVQD